MTGGQLASASQDGTVKLWDVKTGNLKQTLQAQSRVNSVAFDGGATRLCITGRHRQAVGCQNRQPQTDPASAKQRLVSGV
ncbi:MAG: hypothetical protein HZT40_03015 [Candidatus Thiothrix singaporensis]|uniref:Anaphase-promoting complex subunit 4 WD40 domain-containing protein n=1 Tax=Candidatus Thiothrix singaporensis TaxID=2799669 RepID=A0A7L6ANS0_9GAMM|nr:MAG: hypothetical protein HZT40_03015 [Candidatus Thiothrix singaporensis]